MTNSITFESDSCKNCHYDQVEHLKASSEICTECFAKDSKEKRYPNWKAIIKES